MFYSQFILAKKGPLGTIWIAAHLERKLRKNQVTETNISVSVDSILFPEVPIALRLSGHLLLGVVRIYSRKVNYLFHDCSEALVKIKQAFHAGAVDLPPEAATAPFHSITLPETFDLDELEPLPDRDLNLLHANGSVDHHVTTREQITLQDSLEDSSYLGTQFGLDERFSDVDAQRIDVDFDEELLLDRPRELSPAAATLQEDVLHPINLDDNIDYGQMDQMDGMELDEHLQRNHHEPSTPALGIDQMEVDDTPHFATEQSTEPVIKLADSEHETIEPLTLTLDSLVENGCGHFSSNKVEPEFNLVETSIAPQELDHLEPATPHGSESEQLEKEKEIENVDPRDVKEDQVDAVCQEKSGDQLAMENEAQELEKLQVPEEALTESATAAAETELKPVLDISFEKEEDIPEYEKVMSAVDGTENDADMFPMESELLPNSALNEGQKDQIMEDVEIALVEEDIETMQEDVRMEPSSPLRSPAFPITSPDDLPRDDDVLATLLGRDTPAFNVMPTPLEANLSKSRKGPTKPNSRKRKPVVDISTILHADVMKQQLTFTDDIRRVRKKAPCTHRELWMVQKELLGHQIFCEPSVPGLCPELRALYSCVYVKGDAKLPLAEVVVALDEDVCIPYVPSAVQDPATQVPDSSKQPETVSLDATFSDDASVLPQDGVSHLDASAIQTQVEAMENTTQVEPQQFEDSEVNIIQSEANENEVGGSAHDPLLSSPKHHLAQVEPSAEGEAHVLLREVEQQEMEENIGFQGETQVLEEDQVVGETHVVEESPVIGGTQVLEDNQVIEETQGIGETQAIEETQFIGETQVLDETHVCEETQVYEEETHVSDETQALEETQVLEDTLMLENTLILEDTQVLEEPLVLGETQILDEPVSSGGVQATGEEVEVEIEHEAADQGCKEAAPVTSAADSDILPAEPENLSSEAEELGFLADARDTVFLAADDDDLHEEAEHFDGGKEYSKADNLVQDNTGWSARTRAVGKYLRGTLESIEALPSQKEKGPAKLGLARTLVGKTRKEAARMFFEALVLKTKDYVHIEQDVPYGDLIITARPKLLKANFN